MYTYTYDWNMEHQPIPTKVRAFFGQVLILALLDTWRLLCSSFLVLTCFLVGGFNILRFTCKLVQAPIVKPVAHACGEVYRGQLFYEAFRVGSRKYRPIQVHIARGQRGREYSD